MTNKIRIILWVSILCSLIFIVPVYAEDGQSVAHQSLERVETILYGAPRQGGLLPRLSEAERDLFGRELPGSLTERQQALQNYLEKGSSNHPPMLFKLGVCEWIVSQRINPSLSMSSRINNLEQSLEGSVQAGPLGARLERLITKLLPEGITSHTALVPPGTVFKARFLQNVSVRTVSKGDPLVLELNEDCIVNGALVAAKGGRVFAEVSKIKRPRSFGRPSEIGIEFSNVEAMDGHLAAVYIGPAAKKAMEIDSATIGAAGASLAGAIVLGPVGLVTGFLVRGNDKQIPAGSLIYVESKGQSSVYGYQLPPSLKNRLNTNELSPQGAIPVETPESGNN